MSMTEEVVKKGRIHSFESFGTVDGPGIRFIVFFQGCMMRCLYCHNRDTRDLKTGKEITVDELMAEIKTYKHFITPNGGGVTASGGEAILQAGFIKGWFKACHKEGIHTCLDTNGYVKHLTQDVIELVAESDLVLLDIKQMKDEVHKKLTGVSNKYTLDFARYLAQQEQPTWIRYVIVPGWTDDVESAHLLGQFIQGMKNIERVELLPYHTMGEHKWQQMGDAYPLAGVEPPPKEIMEQIKDIIASYGHAVLY